MNTKVLIYSTHECPYCLMAEQYFKDKKIEFQKIDVSKSKEKFREMVKKSNQIGVPVIEIAGKIIVGFDKEKIEEILKKAKR